MDQYLQMLRQRSLDLATAAHYIIGVITAIVVSDRSSEDKVAEIAQALEALEVFERAQG